ncbi:glucose-6-phosphate isomerase [Bartonella sp. DGB2]|uniref:glucose-6-phosphate isomerase n=1 Tax=Bartonella sp. DGB2 TaxID=3388426 RepID=UPI0039901DFB
MRHETMFWNIVASLKAHATQASVHDIRQHFVQDSERFEKFSLWFDDLLFDFSKSNVTKTTMDLLHQLSHAANLLDERDTMFAAKPINVTEHRAVLHVALRAPKEAVFLQGGHNVVEDVHQVLDAMSDFCEGVRKKIYRGATNEPITDIVSIGIGGSSLGSSMVTMALRPYHDGPRCHFVSNVDSAHICDILALLKPANTLFIIASKAFTTQETMANAAVARRWIVDHLGETAVTQHFVAVSTALDKVEQFGIAPARTFGFWPWVGGRFSVWSPIGMAIMMAIGSARFKEFLAGAHAMDQHFRTNDVGQNIPMLLGLLGFWQRVICGYSSRVVVPYAQRLARFPAYLQQVDMESNGKSVDREGIDLTIPSGPIVWGEPGTDGQHAFFQLLHQGTDIVPAEFFLFARGHEKELSNLHHMLLANGLAQSEALMRGRTMEEAYALLRKAGMDELSARKLSPHKSFPGNRPSVTFLQERLTPFALGRLMALYEHRVFVEGILMNINSFDQWGVELGKELANELLPMVDGRVPIEGRDGSTRGLLAYLLQQHGRGR